MRDPNITTPTEPIDDEHLREIAEQRAALEHSIRRQKRRNRVVLALTIVVAQVLGVCLGAHVINSITSAGDVEPFDLTLLCLTALALGIGFLAPLIVSVKSFINLIELSAKDD